MAYEPTEWARGTKITAQKLNNIERGVESVNSEYIPTTWAEGDIVTATKLNNIEQGIANASGGGGDFSTAEVTIINRKGGNTTLYIPNADELSGTPFQPACVADVYILNNETVTINAILYKGRLMIVNSPDIAATGSVEISNNMLIITGNCTLTLS